MRRIAVSAFLISAAAMLSGCPAHERATISSAEIKQLGDAELAHRLLGAAATPFTQAMRTDAAGLPLVIFATDPKPSEEADLCEFTQLRVQFKKVAADQYAVAAVRTGQSFLTPEKPMGAPQAIVNNEDWQLRARGCAARGPAISHDKLSPKAFRVWGLLAAGGTGRDASFAMRVLQAARTASAAQTLPTASCEDEVRDGRKSICGDPRAAIGAVLAHDPGDSGLTIDRCRGERGRVCVNLSDWPNGLGVETAVSIETDAKSADLIPDDAAITGITITRDPVIVE